MSDDQFPTVAAEPDAAEPDAAEPDAAEPDAAEPDVVGEQLPGDAQVRFLEVVVNLPSSSPIVVLEEVAPPCRVLRIPIGMPEGVAIAYAASGASTPKPLTHELFMSTLEAFAMTVDLLRITAVRQNAFTAEIVLSGPKGSRTLACRPSDGIALALRQRLGAPIMVAPDVIEAVGIDPTV